MSSGPREHKDVESLLPIYNDGLREALDRHAPLAIRRVRDRPSAPWLCESVREARRARRRAERRWRKKRLTVFRQIYVKERKKTSAAIDTAKRQFLEVKIDSARNSKTLFNVANEFFGAKLTKPLPNVCPQIIFGV